MEKVFVFMQENAMFYTKQNNFLLIFARTKFQTNKTYVGVH